MKSVINRSVIKQYGDNTLNRNMVYVTGLTLTISELLYPGNMR
nr:MAG TPA: hypothetical protein [Caudoviricetes sp.]